MSSRVLVTGSAGFTAIHLREALESRGFTMVPAGGPPEFDILDSTALVSLLRRAQPDYVIHLAGISFVPHGDAQRIYAVNAVGTSLLLETLVSESPQVRKVLIASSANVYGNATASPIHEDTTPMPVNHYGCSKLAAEHISRSYFDRLPLIVVRPFNYTGLGQDPRFLVPKLVSAFARRDPAIPLGNVNVERDFSDVRMVCDCYARLLDSEASSTFLNVCSGTGRSLTSLLDQLTELAGYRPRIDVDPALVRNAEVHRLVGDNARLRQTIGDLRFLDFGLTLRWMFEHLRSVNS